MSLPQYRDEDFRDALLNLLPTGSLWSRSPKSILGKIFLLLGRVFQRNNVRAIALIRDVFPGTTENFLKEWENTLGLPDSCSGVLTTQEQRRNAIIAKLADEGGSSVSYYKMLAAHSGTTIHIEEFSPARAGLFRAGQACFGKEWAFAWRITLPKTLITPFRAHYSAAGEPLQAWQSGYIECVLSKRAPAHTCVLFAYHTP